MFKALTILALICIAQCHYEKKFAKAHNFDLSEEAQEQYLKSLLNCGAEGMKADTPCFCGTLDLACCANKAKCTGDTTKKCTEKKDKECDNEIKTGIEYYKKESEEMKKLYCDKQTDNTAVCLCGMIDLGCCKSKDKCESKYMGAARICNEKPADPEACNKKIAANIKTPAKPWFYKRLCNSAFTLFMGIVQLFGLIAVFALF